MRAAALLRRRSKIGAGVRLPGTAGNYVSTPDSVLNSITGDIDIRMCLKVADWANGSERYVFGKWSGVQSAYLLGIGATGTLILYYSTTGVNVVGAGSTAATGFAAGSTHWIRATLDVDNGAGGHDRKFYISDDGVTWTQLGTTVTVAGVIAIFDGNVPVEVGSTSSGAGLGPVATYYYAEVRNGIDGPIAAKFDASQVAASGAMVPATINGWTWNGTALYKRDDYVRLPGTSGNYLGYPSTVANSVTGDIDIRVKVSMDDWTPAAESYLLAKEQPGLRSYCLGVTPSGALDIRFSLDGSVATGTSSSANMAFADGSVAWVRCTRQASTGNCNFYTSLDGTTWSLLGTADRATTAGAIHANASVIELGSRAGGGSDLVKGNIYAAEVRNGINGTVVASFDARTVQTPWTINGAGWSWEGASFSGRPTTALSLTGATGNYASTPDSAGNSVTGDIDIRAKVSLGDWTPAAFTGLAGKWNDSSAHSYLLAVNTGGALYLYWSTDGTNGPNANTTAPLGFADGSVNWVRATRNATSGQVLLYSSPDGVTWTPLASTGGASGAMFDSTAPLSIGAYSDGAAAPLDGKIYYAEVRNGIDGPIVARFDPTAIARTGVRTPTTTVQPGGTPNMLTPNQASLETDTTGWEVTDNGTIARSTAQALDGAASLALTATANGWSVVRTVVGVPVVPGKAYTAKAYMRAATVARPNNLKISWWSSLTVWIGQSVSDWVADTTAGWTLIDVPIGVAPPGAQYATVDFIASIDAAQLAGEVHYVDRISLVESAAVWTMNGAAWDLVQV